MSETVAPYPAWIYRQSAVLGYRRAGKNIEVLLITSRGGKHWLLPKGIVAPGASAAQSALTEAQEEAGVDGIVDETPLGAYRYQKWGGTCSVEVYPLEVVTESDDWPEAGFRRRRWFALRKALARVDDPELRAVIEKLPAALSASTASRPVPDTGAGTGPARLVYLLRHAKSSWSDATLADHDRPLAPRGERACEAMRRYMTLAEVHPDLVLCSTAVRTRQTIERVMPALGEGTPVEFVRELYLAEPEDMITRLRGADDELRSVMFVGHNPGMQELAIRLTGSGAAAERERLASKFPTAALAILVYRGAGWAGLDEAGCELHSLVRPKDIGEDPGFR